MQRWCDERSGQAGARLIEVARGRSVVGEDGKVYRPGESLEVDRADADALIGDGFALDSEETGAVAAVIQPIQGRQTIKMVSRQESVTQQPAATSGRSIAPISRSRDQ